LLRKNIIGVRNSKLRNSKQQFYEQCPKGFTDADAAGNPFMGGGMEENCGTQIGEQTMEFILYEQKGEYAIITINREKALNALNSTVLEELDKTIDAVDINTVRCLILTGAGQKSFVAGADIGEMSTLTKAEGEAFGKKGNDVFRKLETLPIPVIAAVNGFALGGGCELSMSCDIRICSDNAVFGQPEVGLGITPGFGGTQRLARLVGAGMAKQMIYTARNIKADEAYRIGLVNAVYPQEELLPAAEKMAAGIAKNAPIAVRNCKKAINEGLDVDMDQALVIEEKLFGDCFETEDQKYGMAFFLDKNKEKVKEPFRNC
jgi:enoyl-CoA hydratase